MHVNYFYTTFQQPTDEPKREVGDVVCLVTGSPDMVVVDVCEDCGTVEVAWYDEGGMNHDVSPEEAIVDV